MNIESLVRPNIRALAPYRSARQEHHSGILLDANENSFGSTLPSDGVTLNRYPDPNQRALRFALADRIGLTAEHVFVGSGSDEAIDLLLRVFCEPGEDRVLIPVPTYGMYGVAAAIQGAIVEHVLLDDTFQLDRNAVEKALRPDTKLVFLCSPNNPTGNLLSMEDVLWLCSRAPGLVVVDEAYVEFTQNGSVMSHVAAIPNLVVLRTLSKAWGLASIRLGYASANPDVVSHLLRVKAPYNVNGLTSAAALSALCRPEAMERLVTDIKAERERLRKELAACSAVNTIFPSDANFLLVRFKNPDLVRLTLLTAGIVVRDRSNEPKLAGCLRITVGTFMENNALLRELRSLS